MYAPKYPGPALEGWTAAKDGKSIQDCPYHSRTHKQYRMRSNWKQHRMRSNWISGFEGFKELTGEALEGWNAAGEGKTPFNGSCPYPTPSDKRHSWISGNDLRFLFDKDPDKI